jgi:N-acetylglucosaminyldiphosphoundecaprenol N-acetyl-beta-D-mannosaminyltransferase
VLGIGIDVVDPAGALAIAARWLARRNREYVCVLNVHAVMEAQRDERVRRVYSRSALKVPDGMPLVWMAHLAGHPSVRRVYGPDLTLSLCQLAAVEGYRCYFYGGAPGVGSLLSQEMERRFPGLRTAGVASPPYRALSAEETKDAIRTINETQADIVFVGLGCPKQDLWMDEHRAALEAPVLIGVGAAFDFLTGAVRQAPGWMQRLGLEWLFRLVHEPRRLWRRYLLLNPWFVACALLQLAGVRRYTITDEGRTGD